MKNSRKEMGIRRVLVTMIFYLSLILAALLVVAFPKIAGLVAVVSIVLALGRLVWVFAWGAAKNGYSWRV